MSEETTTAETPTETADEGQPIATSFMDGKYESVSALEEGYKNLQTTFSQKTAEYSKAVSGLTGAPEAYEFNEGLTMSDGMQEYAREQNFSNDALNGLAEAYQNDRESSRESYKAEQIDLLGKDADSRLNNVEDWAKANIGDDYMETLNSMVSTAQGVEVFEKIMKLSNGTGSAQVAQPRTVVDREVVKGMRFAMDEHSGQRMMSIDPAYRAKVENMEAELVASGEKL